MSFEESRDHNKAIAKRLRFAEAAIKNLDKNAFSNSDEDDNAVHSDEAPVITKAPEPKKKTKKGKKNDNDNNEEPEAVDSDEAPVITKAPEGKKK